MATPFDFANIGSMFGGGMGGTPTGIDALLNEDQRKLMNRNAALSAAAALLQASGRSTTPIGLGQALGSALQAGQQGYQQARAGSVQDLMMNQKLEEAKRAEQVRKQIADVMTTAPQPLNTAQAALAAPGMPLGPTTQRAELMDSMPQPTANELKATQYQTIADIYAAQGKSEDAKRYQEIAEKLNPRPEVSGQPFEVTDATGKPLLVQQMKSGALQTLQGFGPKREVVLQSLGGRTVAINKSALKGGESFETTMTPSEAANLRISQGNLDVARGGLNLRLRESATGDRFETPEGFFQMPRTGGPAVPVMGPGGTQLKGVSGGQASEGERKAGSLLARLNLAETQMGGEGASGAPGFFTGMSPRIGLAEGRKRVEDAQLDFLDAALTLSTGAAYTEAQLKGAQQSYFPKYGDDSETIRAKEIRRKNLAESAKLAAGRMAPAVQSLQGNIPPATGGTQRRSLDNIFGGQ